MIYILHLWKLKRHHVICHKSTASKWCSWGANLGNRMSEACSHPYTTPLLLVESPLFPFPSVILLPHPEATIHVCFHLTIFLHNVDGCWGGCIIFNLHMIFYYLSYCFLFFTKYPFLRSIHVAMCSFNLSSLTCYIIVYDFYSPRMVAPIHTAHKLSMEANPCLPS